MKKLLFILDTFHPEYASTGQLMTELCQYLQQDFHVTVIVGIPQYGVELDSKYSNGTFFFEQFENISIVRVRTPKVNKESKASRMKYMIVHFLNALRATFKVDKPDLIYVISQPPIIGGMLGGLTKFFRGGKLLYNIQDFNPEQIEAVGYSKMKWLVAVARWIDNCSIKYSDKIVVVGRDMYKTVQKRYRKPNMKKVEIINNWIDEKTVVAFDKSCQEPLFIEYCQKYNPNDKFTIMYSGNIGLYYDLENIIKVIGKFSDIEDLQFVFVGEGSKKKELEDYVSDKQLTNVKFFPYAPKESVHYSLNAADVHFVTNQKGIKGVSVPSKIYGVLAVGKPVFGILEEASEAQLIIDEAKCGKWVEPKDYDSIEKLIHWYYNNRENAMKMGDNGRKYLEENLKRHDSLEKYHKAISKLLRRK